MSDPHFSFAYPPWHRLCLNRVMDPIEHFSRLFAYDGWANQEVLTNLRATRTQLPQALKLMSHIFAAERLWMERLEQKPQTFPVWPEFTAEECERQASELPVLWKNIWPPAAKPNWPGPSAYQNSQGETFSSRKDDILTHLITHSSHHRGQVAAAVRAAGFTPAYTDFIHCIRQGFVK